MIGSGCSRSIDYMGIYTLIAGSYTAIVWNVLSGSWRRGILMVVWLWAVAGSAHRLLFRHISRLAIAPACTWRWDGVPYCAISRLLDALSHRNLLPIVVGGVLYSLGAVINLLHQPVLWPGVFQAHELFHIFVVAGSLAHYWFMLTVIAPYVGESEATSPVQDDRRSNRRFAVITSWSRPRPESTQGWNRRDTNPRERDPAGSRPRWRRPASSRPWRSWPSPRMETSRRRPDTTARVIPFWPGRSGEGHGYRAIDHPDRPRHAHFPPGYPVFLALVWGTTGDSAVAAHVASCVCTVAATLAAWWWFRRLHGRHVALVLGLALAVNWAWARTGSAIQSEPLYEMLGQFTILAAIGSVSKGGIGRSIVLGGLMAACLLTRHVAIALVLAVLLDLLIRRRWSSAMAAAAVTLLLIAPWVGWLLFVGGEHRTQASLVLQAGSDALARAAAQSVFYIQRLPDQITGPLVEIATIVPRSRPGRRGGEPLGLARDRRDGRSAGLARCAGRAGGWLDSFPC